MSKLQQLTMMVCLLACGCGAADDRFSVAQKDSISVGMTKSQVEEKIGKPTTTVVSFGDVETVQWTRGGNENVSSIAVSYTEGKVISVAGSNLK